MTEIEKIDKQIAANQKVIAEGIALHSPREIQMAKDSVVSLQKQKYKIDYEARKPFIKIVEVNQPIGNSSVNCRRGSASGRISNRHNVSRVEI